MNINVVIKTIETSLKIGGKFAIKHLPTILTAVGTVGVVAGTVLMAKKAPEAQPDIQEVKDNKPEDKVEYAWRLIKVGARYYGVICLIIAGSIVCFWAANHINLKRLGAAVAAAKISADYAKDLENQIKKDGGDGKLTKFKDEINAEKLQNGDIPPIPEDTGQINHSIGETPIWGTSSRSWYITTTQNIKQAAKCVADDLYAQLMDNDWTSAFVPLGDLLNYAKLEPSGPNMTDDVINYLGFGVDIPSNMTDKDKIYQACLDAVEVGFTTLMKDNSVGALAVKWTNPPKYKFDYE